MQTHFREMCDVELASLLNRGG